MAWLKFAIGCVVMPAVVAAIAFAAKPPLVTANDLAGQGAGIDALGVKKTAEMGEEWQQQQEFHGKVIAEARN
jgi:hypothetical protein